MQHVTEKVQISPAVLQVACGFGGAVRELCKIIWCFALKGVAVADSDWDEDDWKSGWDERRFVLGKEDGGGDLRQRKFQIQQQNCFLYVFFSYFFMQLWIFTYFILFLFSIYLTLAIKIYN